MLSGTRRRALRIADKHNSNPLQLMTKFHSSEKEMKSSPNLSALKRMGDFLTTKDVIEVLGVSRTTVYKYETYSIDNFPRSVKFLGKKGWTKDSIAAYIKAQTQEAAKYEKLMHQCRAA